MLIAFTYLPGFVTLIFRGMPTVWRGRHRLIFMQAVHPGRKTLEEMARWTPATITAWRFGRLLKAAYWNVHLLVSWLAQDLVATLPAPANGILYLFGDGSHADKRGTKNPVAQKGRNRKQQPWFFGLRFVLLMAAWGSYRFPVGFRLILPKCHPGYLIRTHKSMGVKAKKNKGKGFFEEESLRMVCVSYHARTHTGEGDSPWRITLASSFRLCP